MEDKIQFLKTDLINLLQNLKSEAKGKWGVMNGQQMVEHMSDSVRIANGKTPKKILTPAELVPKYKTFMLSEKPFKKNTKNIELSEVPPPAQQPSMQAAINELKNEIADFFAAFEKADSKIITNPFFGDLNFEEWVHLLHKHATHHCKQFGLIN